MKLCRGIVCFVLLAQLVGVLGSMQPGCCYSKTRVVPWRPPSPHLRPFSHQHSVLQRVYERNRFLFDKAARSYEEYELHRLVCERLATDYYASHHHHAWNTFDYALSQGFVGTARLLMAYINFNAHDEWTGETLLHRAVKRGVLDEVQALLAHGARPDERDREGKTPLDVARELGCGAIVAVLGG